MKSIRTRPDFERTINGRESRLVLFYSAYCPFCLALLPIFETRAAKKPDAFAQVCTDSLSELEDSFAITVVPSVLFFKGGSPAGRLDGTLGAGLTGKELDDFINSCGA